MLTILLASVLSSGASVSTDIEEVEFGKFQVPIVASEYSLSTRPTSHRALDIRSPIGTKIQAIADGEVAFVDRLGAYGLLVIILHDGGYQSRYAHLKSSEVEEGDMIKAGDLVGFVGMTGRTSGPHLHFEILAGGSSSDDVHSKNYQRMTADEIIDAIGLSSYSWSNPRAGKKSSSTPIDHDEDLCGIDHSHE